MLVRKSLLTHYEQLKKQTRHERTGLHSHHCSDITLGNWIYGYKNICGHCYFTGDCNNCFADEDNYVEDNAQITNCRIET